MMTDKNHYFISLNKRTYEIIEPAYNLSIYDYETGEHLCLSVSEGDHDWNRITDLELLMYQELKKLETDYTGLKEAFINLCNENNLTFESIGD